MINTKMGNKNKIGLLMLFCLLSTGVLKSQWITEKAPVSENLNSIALISDNTAWIVGNKGAMIYKVNSDWVRYPGITDNNLYSIFMIDKDNGWCVGSNGTLLHFNGTQWEKYESPTKENLYSVSFRDSEHGIAVGNRGTVLIYENRCWSVREADIMGDLYTVSDKNDISLAGGGMEYFNMPLMKIEENSGSGITRIFDPGYSMVKSLAVNDKNSIWTVGMAGSIFHYDGTSWKSVKELNNIPTLNSVYFAEKNTGMAVGYGGTILTYSENGWTKEVSPVVAKLNGAAVSGNKYYAVGNNGTIVSSKYIPENEAGHIGKTISAIEIKTYPNPTSDKLNIIITDGEGFNANLISVTNASGQVVFNKNLDPSYSGQVYQVNTSNMTNGIYIVNLKSAGNMIASGKFVVMH
jgi:photosystem II stability/assembly factor-like uncharacterized protein